MKEPRGPSCALGMLFRKFGVPSGPVVWLGPIVEAQKCF